MITSDAGLIDANFLVYAINENVKQHAAALKLVESGLNGEIPICFTPQVFSEFFAPLRIANKLRLCFLMKTL